MSTILISQVNGLNLRQDSNTDSAVLASISKNERVEFIRFDDTKTWVEIRRNNGTIGWASYKYFVALSSDLGTISDPLWLQIAYGEYGISENENSVRVEEYLRSCEHLSKNSKANKTAWCSAFVNWCMEKSNYSGTNSAWAQSWKDWGKQVKVPFRGCIAVFKRYYKDKDGVVQEGGHVGFFIKNNDNGKISILGGNQSNKVMIQSYPINNVSNPPKAGEYKLIGYYKPLS